MLEVIFSGDTATIVSVIIITYLIFKYVSNSNLNYPPGPKGSPIVGCMSLMKNRKPKDVYKELRDQYGDNFSIQLGSKLFVVINGYDNIREAFIKHGDQFSDRPDTYNFKELSKYKGILASSGNKWKQTRSWMLSSLRNFGFGKKSLETKIIEEVEIFLQVVSDTKGQPFDVKHAIQTSVSNIICSIVFGDRFDHNSQQFHKLVELFEEVLRLNAFTGPLSFFPFLKYLPGDRFGLGQLQTNMEKIRQFLRNQIESHRESFNSENIRDIIDEFLLEQKQHGASEVFDDTNLLFSIQNLFIAGTETTATTIRWTILYLLHNRDVLRELQQEIKNVVGTSRLPSLQDRPNMPFFEAVITETLRCGNILPLSVPHGATNYFTFKGFTIPKGAVIIPNLDSVLNDPKLFSQPEKFNPHRFLDENRRLAGNEKVLAFSLGRRVCLGEGLARMELFLFLTSLIQRFDIRPEQDGQLPSLEATHGMLQAPVPFLFRAVPM